MWQYSPDGELLASVAPDNRIRVYDAVSVVWREGGREGRPCVCGPGSLVGHDVPVCVSASKYGVVSNRRRRDQAGSCPSPD